MKKDKKVIKAARQIMQLEKEMYSNDDINFYQNKIDKIKSSLSEEQLCQVNSYIMEQEKK